MGGYSKFQRDKILTGFGQTLRQARVKRGLTQEDLALETDIDRAFISRIERGVSAPSLFTIFSIAEALDINPGTLVKQAYNVSF